MNNLELFNAVLDAMTEEQRAAFKHRLAVRGRVCKPRVDALDVKGLAHWTRARGASTSRTKVERNGFRWGESPQQAYDRVYEARLVEQLAYLKQMLTGG